MFNTRHLFLLFLVAFIATTVYAYPTVVKEVSTKDVQGQDFDDFFDDDDDGFFGDDDDDGFFGDDDDDNVLNDDTKQSINDGIQSAINSTKDILNSTADAIKNSLGSAAYSTTVSYNNIFGTLLAALSAIVLAQY
jgi:hypothetical protein